MSNQAYQRRREIEAIVTRLRYVRVTEIAHTMRLSPMTVRRDIEFLDADHRVRKTHGGAISIVGDDYRLVDEGSPETTDAQWAAIASAAVEIVPPHSSVAVNAGPAALHLANHLVDVEGLTIITNSLTVANIVDRSLAIRGREWVDLILTGGLRSSSGALVGPTALAALTRINPALLLLSVDGADENAGLTTSDVLEAEINRAFLARAGQSVVVVSAAQWGTVGMNFLAPFDGSGFLVTDAQLDNGAAAKIGACGVSVRRVGANLVL